MKWVEVSLCDESAYESLNRIAFVPKLNCLLIDVDLELPNIKKAF